MNLWAEQRGQVIAQLAMFMVVLLAFVALAIDFGHVYAERRRVQAEVLVTVHNRSDRHRRMPTPCWGCHGMPPMRR